MKIYNTLTRSVEEFIPHEEGKVKMYTCGPTVYHYAHIGNMRNYVGHDFFEKTLRYLGYEVTRAMNITDVGHLTSDSDSGEDKMLKAVKREHKSAMEIAKFYTEEFFKDFDKLNCKRPEIVVPATGEIDMYIKIIGTLLEKGFAYQSGGNVYFDVSKLDDYYKLTNHKIDDMVVGVRDGVEYDNSKRNQADFALWFTTSKFENQELAWDSPYGRGYPGWHIECSGISIKYLGEYLDVHGGGVDNIFPHHTNEIAQSESYLGHEWCHYWFHNEHLIEKDGKMSKSKGDILTVTKLEEDGHNPLAFRYMCLNTSYRKQLLFSFDALDQAEKAYSKLKNKVANLKEDGDLNTEEFNSYKEKFSNELANDVNTPNALAVLYEVLGSNLNGTTKLALVKDFEQVLSLDLIEEKQESIDDAWILELIEERKEAKKEKNFEKADKIRNDLLEKGIELIDSREGTTYKIK